jgi:hypothetical protein
MRHVEPVRLAVLEHEELPLSHHLLRHFLRFCRSACLALRQLLRRLDLLPHLLGGWNQPCDSGVRFVQLAQQEKHLLGAARPRGPACIH